MEVPRLEKIAYESIPGSMKHQIIKNTSNKYDPLDSNALGYMQGNRLKPLRAKFVRAIKTIGLKYSHRFPPRISINTVNAEKNQGISYSNQGLWSIISDKPICHKQSMDREFSRSSSPTYRNK
jgi:hypothetical protein